MATVRWALVALMAAIAAAAWIRHGRDGGEASAQAAALFRCPMHPSIVQDGPGSCPVCGMDLVADAGAPPPAGGASTVPGRAPVALDDGRRELMGMRTAPAVRRRLSGSLRVFGSVSADERKVAVVTARAGGWIDRLLVAQSGERVRQGDVLVMLDSPELLTAQQTYLTNFRWRQNLASSPNAGNPVAQTIDRDSLRRLRVYGMAAVDIEALERRGEPSQTVPIRAPISGWVVRRNAVPGQFVAQGTELYQLADLSTVWVVGELAQQDAARVAVGQKATLEVSAHPGERFEGRVDFIYPAVDPETRALQARMVFRNAELKLRPGMFGDLRVEAGGPEALVVPAEAVVDAGDLQYVFVAKGEGRFEPRVVKVGLRDGEDVVVLSGLAAGDEVVTTANFYLDAESRLRAALEGRGASDAPGATAP